MKNKSAKKILLAIVILGIIAIAYSTGILSSGSGIKIGWKEDTFGDKWAASYFYYTGIREKKLTIKDNENLYMRVNTEKGKIAIEIQDMDGTIIYSKENIESSEIEISVVGTVKVKVVANGHKGGFEFSWH